MRQSRSYLISWIVLLVMAISMSFTLPKPMNLIQAIICSMSLSLKLDRLFNPHERIDKEDPK